MFSRCSVSLSQGKDVQQKQVAKDVVIQGMMAGFGEAAHSSSCPSVADHTAPALGRKRYCAARS